MTSTLVRGKYVICKITGPSSAEVVYDGAVLHGWHHFLWVHSTMS